MTSNLLNKTYMTVPDPQQLLLCVESDRSYIGRRAEAVDISSGKPQAVELCASYQLLGWSAIFPSTIFIM